MTDIHNTKSESYLPKAESPERPHLRIKSKDSDKSPSSIAKALISYQNQAQVAIEQVDRLRKALREKDMDLAVTKSENALLKQIERRYQKDMELQELHHQDAPRIIKGLRDEISHLKAKIKTYFSQLGEDSRTIRQMDEERRRLRDHSHRLETLVAQEQLEDRDSLCTKLNESLEEISRLQRTLSETSRKSELDERNLLIDNKHLRQKLSHLQKDNLELLEKSEHLETQIREKEKVISSLSIYRYNAIHKKAEHSCKTCIKRDKDDKEKQHRLDVISRFPAIDNLNLNVLNATSVEVSLDISGIQEATEFSKIIIRYRSENASDAQFGHNQEIINVKKPLQEKYSCVIKDLQCGKSYQFRANLAYLDIESDNVLVQNALVDSLPNPPRNIQTRVLKAQNAIQILFQAPLLFDGSPVKSYRLYQNRDQLTLEEPVEAVRQESEHTLSITLLDAQRAIPYIFNITAVSNYGESVFSEPSEETMIDDPPEQPQKPTIKRCSANSVELTSETSNNFSSKISSFGIYIFKHGPGGEYSESKMEVFPTSSNKMVQKIDNLTNNCKYQFQVYAVNNAGTSLGSETSDCICLDDLVPPIEEVNCKQTNPTSVEVTIKKGEYKLDKVAGIRIMWQNAYGKEYSETILPHQNSFICKDLERGESYMFSACYFNKSDDGIISNQTLVSLSIEKEPSIESSQVTDSSKLSETPRNSIKESRSTLGSTQKLNTSVSNINKRNSGSDASLSRMESTKPTKKPPIPKQRRVSTQNLDQPFNALKKR